MPRKKTIATTPGTVKDMIAPHLLQRYRFKPWFLAILNMPLDEAVTTTVPAQAAPINVGAVGVLAKNGRRTRTHVARAQA